MACTTELHHVTVLKRLETAKSRWLQAGSDSKESACNAGDPGLIPEWRRSPGEGNGNPLQCFCLENPMDGGAWQATVLGVAKSQTRLSDFMFTGLVPFF